MTTNTISVRLSGRHYLISIKKSITARKENEESLGNKCIKAQTNDIAHGKDKT